jgi:hypothetical protein
MSVQPKLLLLGLLLLLSNLIFAQNTKSITVGEYQTTIKDKRLALVIGNFKYTGFSKLHSPDFDAKVMTAALQECGFEVIYLENGTKQSIESNIDIFSKKLKSYDVGLIYYSGHGAEIDGVTYLVPVDLPSNASLTDVKYKCVLTNWAMEKMAEAGDINKTYIMVLDACRDNPFLEVGKSTKVDCWTKPKNTPSGSIVCFAASNGEQASQGVSLSPYTELFLKHMKTPGLKLEDVFKEVRIDLTEMRRLNPKINQVPEEATKLTTNFYFVPAKDGIITKPQTTPEVKNTDLATLKILSTAKGTIKIDGELKGTIQENEIKVFKLEPGEYFVQLFTEKDNIPYNEEIKLSASKTETLKFDIISKNQNISKTEPDKSEPSKTENNKLVINIKGKYLEVYHKNLGDMDWLEAKKSCEKLGEGWRLPTSSECEQIKNLLFDAGKGNFKSGWYYDTDGNFIIMEIDGYAFVGRESGFPQIPKKAYIRPVRDL